MEKCEYYKENFVGSPAWCCIICKKVGCEGDRARCECRDVMATRERLQKGREIQETREGK